MFCFYLKVEYLGGFSEFLTEFGFVRFIFQHHLEFDREMNV